MFLTNLLNNFSVKIQGLLIGKMYSPVVMGYYSKAHNTEGLASTSVSSIMTQVTYPLYAEAQNDLKLLGNMIRRLTMTIAYITFPLLFILILLAKPIFIVLYSERWLASVPYFQVLCIAGMGVSLTSINTQAIAAIGKSKVMFNWTVIKRTIGIGSIVGGLFLYGMKGLLAGVVFSNWFSFFVNICLVSKYIGYNFWNQIRDLTSVILVSILAAALSYGVGYLLHLDLYLDGLVKLWVYVVVYLGWSFLFKPEAYTYFLSVIPNKIKFFKKFKKN
jgi:O-antigen/teichoic acid export membrane protein